MWLFCSQLSPVLYVRPRWTKSHFPPGFSRWHLCIIWDLTSKITGPWGCYVQLTKTPSIISLNYVVSHPSRQLKIPSVAFQSLTSMFRQHIFSVDLVNKSSFCFRTSQIPLERWFPSPGLSPWYTLALGRCPHPQNHTKPSASRHPFTHHPPWMLSSQPAPCLASSAPSIFSLPLYKDFWVFSQVPPMLQGRFVERTLRNVITLFKLFLKTSSLSGKLQ